MPFINPYQQLATYAEFYSKIEITGTKYLAYRDIPNIVKDHVTGNKALDYGCGSGKSSAFLQSLGLDVTGVDINEEMLKIAQTRDPTGVYNCITSGRIHSAEDKTYDLVFSSWVMVHVSSKQELINISKEIHRVLKKDGIFIMIVCSEDMYNRDWLTENTEFPENRNITSGSIVKIHFKDVDLTISDYFWSEEDYKEVLDQANLKLINIHKPLGNDQDGYPWVNEKTLAPYSIFIARKC